MSLAQDDERKPIRVVVPEMEWLGQNEARLELEIPGKWIAIKGRELIAVGDTLAEIMRIAESQGIPDPLVTAIKRKEYQNVYLIRDIRRER